MNLNRVAKIVAITLGVVIVVLLAILLFVNPSRSVPPGRPPGVASSTR